MNPGRKEWRIPDVSGKEGIEDPGMNPGKEGTR